MTNKKIAFFLFYIVIGTYFTDIAIIEGISEWHVSVGDSKSYIFTEVYDSRSDNPNQILIRGYDENGQVEIILKKGAILSYTITQLNPSSDTIYGYRTYNKNVSLREEPFSEIVRKTVHNFSYWEEYSENEPLYSISDNLLIREEEWFISQASYSYFQKEVSVWDLGTGWIIFSSIMAFNPGETYYNVSLELLEGEKYSIFYLPTNFIFGLLLLVCIALFYFISKSYHQKLMKKK